ncbi:MAG: FecR domain-containing protein, partial [Verrucomicrobiota bacterium]
LEAAIAAQLETADTATSRFTSDPSTSADASASPTLSPPTSSNTRTSTSVATRSTAAAAARRAVTGNVLSFPRRAVTRWLAPLAVAAAVALLCGLAARRYAFDPTNPASPWSVATMTGTPRIAAKRVHNTSLFHIGQWLETDAASRAKVNVGSIGELRVAPNSRVRLVGTAANDHRIELARGSLEALIWAPPRLFFVDTPSATAIDLGCAYTLTVDDAGDSELHVTAGYVALAHGDREAIIPSGLKCRTRRGAGPGTPYDSEAPPAMLAALDDFDFGPPTARDAALARLLALATTADDVTLWHLLPRTNGTDRLNVYETLARLRPLPPGVTRKGILSGEPTMRSTWGTALGIGTFDLRN